MIPVAERTHEYAPRGGATSCARAGVRVHVDDRSEKLGYKIREAQVQKVPYMLVVGDKEVEARNVAVRHRQRGRPGRHGRCGAGARRSRGSSAERATQEEAVSPGRCPIDQKAVRINDRIRAKEVRVIDDDGGAARHHAAQPRR